MPQLAIQLVTWMDSVWSQMTPHYSSVQESGYCNPWLIAKVVEGGNPNSQQLSSVPWQLYGLMAELISTIGVRPCEIVEMFVLVERAIGRVNLPAQLPSINAALLGSAYMSQLRAYDVPLSRSAWMKLVPPGTAAAGEAGWLSFLSYVVQFGGLLGWRIDVTEEQYNAALEHMANHSVPALPKFSASVAPTAASFGIARASWAFPSSTSATLPLPVRTLNTAPVRTFAETTGEMDEEEDEDVVAMSDVVSDDGEVGDEGSVKEEEEDGTAGEGEGIPQTFWDLPSDDDYESGDDDVDDVEITNFLPRTLGLL